MSELELDPETDELIRELRRYSTMVEDNRKMDRTNLRFKIDVAVVSLTARLLDLLEATALLAKNEHYMPAIILSRCCLETSALLAFVNKTISIHLEDGDDKKLEDTLDKIAAGTRDDTTSFAALNILTIIDKLDKEFPNIRNIYDRLSEYAHPNWTGTFGTYLRVRGIDLGFEVSPLGKALEKDLEPAVSISVAVAALYRRRISGAFSKK